MNPLSPQPRRGLRHWLWRVHFWTACLASPLALLALTTGLLYLFAPNLEAIRYANLYRLTPASGPTSGAWQNLDSQVARAQSYLAPHGRVIAVVPPLRLTDTTRIEYQMHQPQHVNDATNNHHELGKQLLYLNPYTLAILGTRAETDTLPFIAKRLHSRLLQSPQWRVLIEITAHA